MRDDCARAITEAAKQAGRKLTANDLRAIEERVRKAGELNAFENPQARRGMTNAERMKVDAERATRDLLAERARNVAQAAEAINKTQEILSRVDAAAASKGTAGWKTIQDYLTGGQENRTNQASIEYLAKAIGGQAKGRILMPLERLTRKYAGLWTNRKVQDDIIDEIYGKDTGNKPAKEVAKIVQEGLEDLRVQENSAGGNVRKLPYGYLPTSWDMFRTKKVPVEEFIGDALTRLRDRHYVTAEGTPMTQEQRTAIISKAYQSITTDGVLEGLGGNRGGGIRNAASDARVLHWKDGESYRFMQGKYGSGSLLELVNSHIDASARRQAAMKTFSARAESVFKSVTAAALEKDVAAKRIDANDAREKQQDLTNEFQIATGTVGFMGNLKIAHAFQNIRSTIASALLGKAPIAAINDAMNMAAVARFWGMPGIQQWVKWDAKAVHPEFRNNMIAQGFGTETLSHTITRFGEQNLGHGVPAQLANVTFQINGLNWLDTGRRIGGAGMLSSRIGQLTRTHASLEGDDLGMMRMMHGGVSDAHWQIWRQAKLENVNGEALLTPQAIMHVEGVSDAQKRDAVNSLMAIILRDTDTIVPMMTNRVQAMTENIMGNPRRGKLFGELQRSMLQFKSFPIAMMINNWKRLQAMPTPGGKALYLIETAAVGMALGAVSTQMKSFVLGNNPQDMNDPKFWGRAFVQSGIAGLVGDLLVNPWASPYKQDLNEQLGPIFGSLSDVYKIAQDIMPHANPEKKSNLGGDVMRFVQRNTPLANGWYVDAVVRHLFWQRIADYLSPGYARRQQQAVQTHFNSSQWWAPSTAASPAEILSGSMRGVTTPQQPNLRTALGDRK